MKSAPFLKFWAAIFRLISADAASVPAFDQGEGASMAEASCRNRRTGWRLRPWALGVCAALLLLGWPMRGYSQTPVATVGAGTNPNAVAVNPVTNKIYVANQGSPNLTVIDGATNTTTTVAAGTNPNAVAVNPVTNKIYVANLFSNNVTVIDGATNTTTTLTAGANPYSVAVNPVTNQIYVANNGSNNVTVIDGATNTTTAVAAGTNPEAVAVNPVTNTIYVANTTSNNVTVIDGATNTTTTVAAGATPFAVAVNPVTNQIYLANVNTNSVTVLAEQQVHPIPLTTTISPLVGNKTTNPAPTFTFSASSNFAPTAPPVDGLYFQLGTWQGPWTPATSTGGGGFSGTAPTLSLGVHILYAYATDGQDASSIMTTNGNGGGSSPVIGNIAAYLFLVTTSQPTTITSANNTTFTVGQAGSFTVTTTGSPTPSVTENGTLPGGVTFTDNGDGTGTLAGTPTAGGTFIISFTATNTAGNDTQNFTLTVNTATTTTAITAHTPNPSVTGQAVTVSFSVTPQFSGTPTGTVTVSDGTGDSCLATLPATSCALTPTTSGTKTLTATYGGDSNFSGSTSAGVSQTVNKEGTTTALASNINPSYVNENVTFTATVTSQYGGAVTGAITFKQGTTTLSAVPLVSGQASYSKTYTAAGTFSITAVYSGDSNNLGSTSAAVKQLVKAMATLTPSSATYAPQQVGVASIAKTITLKNFSSSPINITNAKFTGTNASDFARTGGSCPYPSGSLGPTTTCTYLITFTPSSNTLESAIFTVTTDVAGSPAATLNGPGTIVKVSPTSENFGNVTVGTTSLPKTVTMKNLSATQDLTINSISTSGPQGSDFAVDPASTCPTVGGVLLHSTSCTVVLKATPSALGTRKATLVFSDIDGGSPQKVSLTVTGI